MTINDAFRELIKNNDFDYSLIEGTVKEITKKLNSVYYSSESDIDHCIIAGSVGRKTSINTSDVDLCFVLPKELFDRYSNRKNNGQSQLLQDLKYKLLERYPNTNLVGDGQVVDANFKKKTIEIVPCFDSNDYIGSLTYPDSNNNGKWLTTNPLRQQNEINEFCEIYPSYRAMCKIIRCWKAENNPLGFKGILIDAVVKYFFENQSDEKYKFLVKDFDFLSCTREFFNFILSFSYPANVLIPGEFDLIFTNVEKYKKKIVKTIKKLNVPNISELWDNLVFLFGQSFPKNDIEKKESGEEFIEQLFPVRLGKFDFQIDCTISKVNYYSYLLSHLENNASKEYYVPESSDLNFYIENCDVPIPYDIYWKIRNVGKIARERDDIRGTIFKGESSHHEKSVFKGPHYVECYIVKNGICVARSRIDVPIE